MQPAYKEDLAYIHDAGFGHLSESAAPLVIELLKNSGIGDGIVVDLGCGSGIAARLFRDAGFGVIGIDVSEPLVERARKRVPDGEFRVGSFVSADIPGCVAVTAIGEVFNYTFDTANSAATRSHVFDRIYASLVPGGVLIFDAAGPARAPSFSPQRTFVEGFDWVVLVEVVVDDANCALTRRITTFRRQGELYRRDYEIHRLQLVDSVDITELLRHAGFLVQSLSCYSSQPLPQGLVGFLAKKPGGVNAQ